MLVSAATAVRRRRVAGRAGSRSRIEAGVRVPAVAYVGGPPGLLLAVLPHHSPAVSPGAGIIAFSRTSSATGDRWQASGALNAPIDWATSTTSSAPAPAATMAWA